MQPTFDRSPQLALLIPAQVGLEETLFTVQPSVESQRSPLRPLGAQCTFPDDCHTPPRIQQFLSRPTVPLDVGAEFRLPEIWLVTLCERH